MGIDFICWNIVPIVSVIGIVLGVVLVQLGKKLSMDGMNTIGWMIVVIGMIGIGVVTFV